MANAIDVEGLTYHYLQEKTVVLKDISFKVGEEKVFGIIGPSGCGKSTLMLAISGLAPRSIGGDLHGKISLFGKDIKKNTMAELSQEAQILFQSPESQLFALNVEDEITFGPENLNLPWKVIEQRLNDVLCALDIEYVRHRSIEELSSGQKQRVALAAILAMKPKILLFDEPTANLDCSAILKLKETIRGLRKKHTVIIIEHNIEFLKAVVDSLLLIDKGKVLTLGTPAEVLRSKEYQRVMLPPSNMARLRQNMSEKNVVTKKKPFLEVKDLNFTYPNKTQVLFDVHLSIGRGEFIGVIGNNGSGKSTLALNLIGLLRGKGQILLGGKSIVEEDVYERAKKIGYVFQNPNYQLFEENLDAEISFGPRNIGLNEAEVQKRVSEILHMTGLASLRETDPHALSVGQKRRVSIASVLAMRPEVLILDEPDTGLDHKTARSVMDYVRRLNKAGMTVIMISHNLELVAEYCTRIVALKEGKIVPPEEIYSEYLNS